MGNDGGDRNVVDADRHRPREVAGERRAVVLDGERVLGSIRRRRRHGGKKRCGGTLIGIGIGIQEKHERKREMVLKMMIERRRMMQCVWRGEEIRE